MTLTEQVLARAAGRDRVTPGEIVTVPVDVALANDITAPVAVAALDEMGCRRVWDPDRAVIVLDHFLPARDEAAATTAAELMRFGRDQGLIHCYGPGPMGIEHALLPELGLIRPGRVIIGADSHTCTAGAAGAFATGVGSTDLAAVWATGEIWLRVPATIAIRLEGELRPWVGGKDVILEVIRRLGVDGANYQALEFGGPGLRQLTMDSRFTITNMAVEAGAKNGIMPPDDVTRCWLEAGGWSWDWIPLDSDLVPDLEIDLSKLLPMVAAPHSPANGMPAADLAGVTIDQVVIGSCTNGRPEDLRIAAEILDGRSVHPGIRLLVFPATPRIYREAMTSGWLASLSDAGAVICPPTCGPCLGGHLGVVAAGERVVATTNRNFRGRMGSTAAEIYLSGPAVAAASAVVGRIADPREVLTS